MTMFVAKTVAAVVIATSFGGPASPGNEAAYDNKGKIESARAACMKEQGLTYLPEPVIKHKRTAEEKGRLAGDYEALRAYRAKYGFGVWSKLVFPGDPAVNPDSGESRNNKILMSLSPAKLKAYRAADDKCFAKAVKAVLGKSVTSQADFIDQVNAAERKGLRALDADKKIARLGKEFAGCLGVGETRPSVLASRGPAAFRKEATEVAKTRHKELPEAAKGKDVTIMPALTPAEARPYLDKEVEAALADLECGKAFYAAYAPRARAVQERVYREFALDFAL
jgi:hypothetical protein